MTVKDHLGRERRMPADLDSDVAPLGIEDHLIYNRDPGLKEGNRSLCGRFNNEFALANSLFHSPLAHFAMFEPAEIARPPRLYDLAALKATCSFDSFSCESEVFKILPPVPCSSSSTFSGLAFLTSTNRLELPAVRVADNSFMK